MKFKLTCLGLRDSCLRRSLSTACCGDQLIVTAIDRHSEPNVAAYSPSEAVFKEFVVIPGKVVSLRAGFPIFAVGFDSKINFCSPAFQGWATVDVVADRVVYVGRLPNFCCIFTFNGSLFEANGMIVENNLQIATSVIAHDVENDGIEVHVSAKGVALIGWVKHNHEAYSYDPSNKLLGVQKLNFHTSKLWLDSLRHFHPIEELLENRYSSRFCMLDNVICGCDQLGKLHIHEFPNGTNPEKGVTDCNVKELDDLTCCGEICGTIYKGRHFFFFQSIDSSIWCIEEDGVEANDDDSAYY